MTKKMNDEEDEDEVNEEKRRCTTYFGKEIQISGN